jgi:RNA polymerase sigma-70 factor, ECF subfamily
MPPMTILRSASETDSREGPDGGALDFDTIYRTYAPRVSMWVRRLLGAASDVEDVVHDVFCVALRRSADYDSSRGEYGAWLHGITIRRVIAHRQRHQMRRLWRAMFAREQSVHADERDESRIHDALDANQVRRRLYGWLDTLPEAHRTVFILFEIEEMDGESIAALLNISVNNVWVRLHRARAALEALAKKAGMHAEVVHAKKQ